MKTVNLIETLENMTLDEIEKEILAIVDDTIAEQVFTFVDCRCCDCSHVFNFDATIDNDPEITEPVCPNCQSDNVIWNKQHYQL